MAELIVIDWMGPTPLRDISKLDDPNTDFGLYQIYAHHPVYGFALVYIGQAARQTFARRIPQHDWATGAEPDPEQVSVYVGRLRCQGPATREKWEREIDAAEALLIHSHAPAYNTSYIKEAPRRDLAGGYDILNFGAARSLHRCVSGLMWTAALHDLDTFEPYRRDKLEDD